MDTKAFLKTAAVAAGTSLSAIADKLGTSRQCFLKRCDHGKFTFSELAEIADALGGRIEIKIILGDGQVIRYIPDRDGQYQSK